MANLFPLRLVDFFYLVFASAKKKNTSLAINLAQTEKQTYLPPFLVFGRSGADSITVDIISECLLLLLLLLSWQLRARAR